MNPTTVWTVDEGNILIPAVSNNSLESNIMVSKISEDTSIGNTILIGLNKSFFGESETSKNVIFVDQPQSETATLQMECELLEDKSDGNYVISFVDASKECAPVWNESQSRDLRKTQKEHECPSMSISRKNNLPHVAADALEVQLTSTEDCSADDDDIEKSLTTTIVQRIPVDILRPAQPNLRENNTQGDEGTSLPGKIPPTPMKRVRRILTAQEMKLLREAEKNQTKPRCCLSDAELSDSEEKIARTWSVELKLEEVETMADLVGKLKDNDFFDESFAQMILRGVAEMKVDILDELKTGTPCKTTSLFFSYELITFAFLLYFHKRNAYHFMSHICKPAWPSIAVLNRWRKLVNSKPKKQQIKRKDLPKK